MGELESKPTIKTLGLISFFSSYLFKQVLTIVILFILLIFFY